MNEHIRHCSGSVYALKKSESQKYHGVYQNGRYILCDCARDFGFNYRIGRTLNKHKFVPKNKMYIYIRNRKWLSTR